MLTAPYDYERLVRRMTTQMRICLARLDKLFLAYSAVLETLTEDKALKTHVIWDKHALNIGNEFGALLECLYALRDAVNSIAFRVLYLQEGSFKTEKFRKKLLAYPQSTFSQLVQKSMFDTVHGDLLIERMSTYRSVALHHMGVSNPATGDCILFKEEFGVFGSILRTVYPLYDDMEKLKNIERGMAEGIFSRRDCSEFMRFMKLDAHTDALDFGFDCLVRLLNMARLLGEELKLESRLFTITEKDIAGVEMET